MSRIINALWTSGKYFCVNKIQYYYKNYGTSDSRWTVQLIYLQTKTEIHVYTLKSFNYIYKSTAAKRLKMSSLLFISFMSRIFLFENVKPQK